MLVPIPTMSISEYELFEINEADIRRIASRSQAKPPDVLGKGEKTPLGAPEKRARFKDKQYYYEWDNFHDGGEWEVYDKQGKHLGAYDKNGNKIKEAKPGRIIRTLVVSKNGSNYVFHKPLSLITDKLNLIPRALRVLRKDEIELFEFLLAIEHGIRSDAYKSIVFVYSSQISDVDAIKTVFSYINNKCINIIEK